MFKKPSKISINYIKFTIDLASFSERCAFCNGRSIYLKRTSLEIKRKHYSQLHDFMATMLLSTGILNDCCSCFFIGCHMVWTSLPEQVHTLFHGGMKKCTYQNLFRRIESGWHDLSSCNTSNFLPLSSTSHLYEVALVFIVTEDVCFFRVCVYSMI